MKSLTQVCIYTYYISGVKNTLPERLEYLFADLGVNQTDFSQKTGFGQSYISQILNGNKTNPSPRFFNIICREFSVNPLWLKTGKGDIYALPYGMGESEDAEILAKYRQLPKGEQRIIEDIINALLVKSGNGPRAI